MSKDSKHDDKRKGTPRLPSSRITDTRKANVIQNAYNLHKEALNEDSNKLETLVDCCDFAINNRDAFLLYLSEKSIAQ